MAEFTSRFRAAIEATKQVRLKDKPGTFTRTLLRRQPETAPRPTEYEIIKSNESSTNAKISMLADKNHAVPAYKTEIVSYINTNARVDDIILVENEPSMQPASSQKKINLGLRHDLQHVLGWDDKEASDVYFDIGMKEVLRNMPYILARGRRKKRLQKIELTPEETAQMEDANRRRNIALVATIKACLKQYPQSRIFLLAGANHVSSKENQPLWDFLDSGENTYVIMSPIVPIPKWLQGHDPE